MKKTINSFKGKKVIKRNVITENITGIRGPVKKFFHYDIHNKKGQCKGV